MSRRDERLIWVSLCVALAFTLAVVGTAYADACARQAATEAIER